MRRARVAFSWTNIWLPRTHSARSDGMLWWLGDSEGDPPPQKDITPREIDEVPVGSYWKFELKLFSFEIYITKTNYQSMISLALLPFLTTSPSIWKTKGLSSHELFIDRDPTPNECHRWLHDLPCDSRFDLSLKGEGEGRRKNYSNRISSHNSENSWEL